MATNYRNGVRIIGGAWKGRKIAVGDAPGLRPTSDRIRETLFNWLRDDISGANCLDLFAGSGALSFEALSRGASTVTAVDAHPKIVQELRQTGDRLDANGLTLICDKAERVLQTLPPSQYDIVFVDPPFDYADYERIGNLLLANKWLSPSALIYLESDKNKHSGWPAEWEPCKIGEAGNVSYQLLTKVSC